jgi:hypothetical protein
VSDNKVIDMPALRRCLGLFGKGRSPLHQTYTLSIFMERIRCTCALEMLHSQGKLKSLDAVLPRRCRRYSGFRAYLTWRFRARALKVEDGQLVDDEPGDNFHLKVVLDDCNDQSQTHALNLFRAFLMQCSLFLREAVMHSKSEKSMEICGEVRF